MGKRQTTKDGDAEFIAKKWVWVADEVEGYLGGWVSKEEGTDRVVVLSSSSQIVTVPAGQLSDMNPPRFDKAADIADLTYLNEASVVHNLRERYVSGMIYTYSSLFLVAVNPYCTLPIYSDAHVQQYRNRKREDNAPHIFAVAERAWISMREGRESQSVLITGESGAGKTENTKKVIQYLAAIASDASISPSSSSSNFLARSASTRSVVRSSSTKGFVKTPKSGLLEKQILQANPILEAFGNAQTMRNNNSSRFGKFVRIFFSPSGAIAGANNNWYLLEKSRVINRSEGERSFHVFYMLLAACSENSPEGKALRDSLLLDGVALDYEYLRMSRTQIDGVNDLEEWKEFKSALDIVGFTPDKEQPDLFKVLAAILLIGNIEISGDRSNQAQIKSVVALEKACHLLGLSPSEFTKAVLRPKVKAGREVVVQARTKQQAVDELGSLCKTMYEKMFASVVDLVNRALDTPTDGQSAFIGVLDIAGFEIFETNSFEQLCINYTNEKLQQFFNHHMFVLEQEEYAREAIEWDYVDFGHDLQSTIELIEGSAQQPVGIFPCLDEECIMPQASDVTFLNKLTSLWHAPDPKTATGGSAKFGTIRFNQGFTVRHYADKVEYRTDGWLEKNKDPLNSNITSLLANSSSSFVAGFFSEYREAEAAPAGSTAGGRRVKSGAFRTVAQRHQEQLAKLMVQLDATEPHFVRCIVPNRHKAPGKVDVLLVLDQLRCNGVLEGIRIARRGYPNRIPFDEFRQRYEILTPGAIPTGYVDGRVAAQAMLVALDLDPAEVKLGTTKIFFKVGVLADLQERLDAYLFDLVGRFQAACQRATARRQLLKIINRDAAVRTIQKNARLYKELKEWPWWRLYTTVQPLLGASRIDAELRRREAELALAQERAQREEQERIALEALRAQLEADKRSIESDLDDERKLRLKEADIHERNAVSLQHEMDTLKADVEVLADQLDRVMESKVTAEAQALHYRTEFEALAGALAELEADREHLRRREVDLSADIQARSTSYRELEVERDGLATQLGEHARQIQAASDDLLKAQDRAAKLEAEHKSTAAAASESRAAETAKIAELESILGSSRMQASSLEAKLADAESRLEGREAEVSRLLAETASAAEAQRALDTDKSKLKAELEARQTEIHQIKDLVERESAARATLESELDELRATMGSEQAKRSQAAQSMEHEIASLRAEVSALEADLTAESERAADTLAQVAAENAALQTKHGALVDDHRKVSVDLASAIRARAEADRSLLESANALRASTSDLQAVRSQLASTSASLGEMEKLKETLDRQVAKLLKKNADYEDAILTIEREKANWAAQMADLQRRLDRENAGRLKLEDAQLKRDAEFASLQDRLERTEQSLAKSKADFKELNAEAKILRSLENKTVVEHVYVLEAAKRLTDRQLADARVELQSLKVYVKSLEKVKAKDVEDVTRQRNGPVSQSDQASSRSSTSASDPDPFQTQKKLEEMRQLIRTQQRAEGDLSTAKQRAEREAAEHKALCRAKDQEIEQLRQQLYNSGGHSFAPSSPSTVRS